MKRVVILGTGTDVGKTYVTHSLARALRSAAPSLPLLVTKPVETGVAPGAATSDHARLAALCHAVDPLSPLYVFPDPLSPHLAARRAGIPLSPDALVRHLLAATPPQQPGICLIETAGGAFTPLATALSNAELARALEPSHWVLVAPDALGVLHDVTATLAALRALAREPDSLVLTAARPPDHSTGTNAAELAALGIWPRVHHLPPGAQSSLAPLADTILCSDA